ncbi:type IV pilin N-terminal domain-containing protein [Halomicroarcula limicola]|uniref:Type IV pilin N-terminal domain-containing protein n=1 Tax=Haloarcula limicola TaxID=1429915 RepID=A0A8J7YA25_9EURY|nr:type IV pilin [Halomicroarcula limicola]MBV0923466.1 type IV pilin N-terminal domain-containing protein [Halomicroarcula limicola]
MTGATYDTRNRAVSPVVGVVLLVAIALLLAATTAMLAYGIGEDSKGRTPQTAFDFDYDRDVGGSDSLSIRHASGDTLTAGDVSLVVSGASASSDPNGEYGFDAFPAFGPGSSVSAGQQVTLDGSTVVSVANLDLSAATVTVRWASPTNGQTVRLARWTGPQV